MTELHFLGVVEPGDDGWWISFPSFPGVVSAGRDWVDMLDNARDALLSACEALHDDGKPIPPDATATPETTRYDPADYRDGRAVMVSIPTKATSVVVDLAPSVLARLDDVATRTQSSRASLLRQGAELVLAAAGDPLTR